MLTVGVMKLFKDSRKTLNKSGLRFTSQRTLILDTIRQGHLDADSIYLKAREKKPRLSLSTVYRTLGILKKLGLVEELHLDELHHYYEAKPTVEHHHLVCLGCGQVIEFPFSLSSCVRKAVPQLKNYRISSAEVRMTGYCPRCRKK